jgi:hypothetical protein
VSDIADRVRSLVAAGCEVGVHGIDAWLDSTRGASERETVACAAGAPATGVRMHWLFRNEQTPARLEEAGYAYDSTFGYNETVGFRTGTLQAFKPLGVDRLLELPLHVMDTALFYPSHLGLTPDGARERVLPLLDEAERHGGALTVNWHDRSIAPERQWGGVYGELLDELKRRGAWFATMAQAAAWFRRRRAARLHTVKRLDGSLEVSASGDDSEEGPGLRVRVHTPWRAGDARLPRRAPFTDAPLVLAARAEA